MTGALRLFFSTLAGAGVAAAARMFSDCAGAPLARAAFSPDILSIAGMQSLGAPGSVMTMFAGGVFGLTLAAGARARRDWLTDGLFLFNPAACFAFAVGRDAALLLSAAALVASAASALAMTRDYRASIVLAVALMLAPFLSHTLIYSYPALLVALPAISPWGLRPDKAVGFSIVIWSPLAMAMGGLAYLNWLLGGLIENASLGDIAWIEAHGSDAVLIAASGVMVAVSNACASRLVAVLSFIAGAGLLAIARSEWFVLF